MRLVIANKNYSSWSLRAWLLLTELGVPFTEQKWTFGDPDWKARVEALTPAGTVPILIDRGLVVPDSLAIAEYVAEQEPRVWPEGRDARAVARAVCAEMHAGFSALRTAMPMNIEARLPGRGLNLRVQQDIDRILAIWADTRERFGGEGPFLFGAFCAADAFYAPVVWRFVTHGIEVPPEAAAYMNAIRGLASMQAWVEEALAEHEYVAMDEPYRAAR